MHEEPLFLQQVAILFGTAVVVAWAFRLLRAPSIVGFLITGVVIGPSALGWIEFHDVHAFAEVGLVLLLFTIGLELSPASLLKTGTRLIGVAGIQVTGCGILAAVIGGIANGWSVRTAIIVGMAVSLSSTAIVLKQLSDRGEIRTPMGRISTGVLLLQDVFVIVVMLTIPFIAGGGGEEAHGGSHGGGGLTAALIGLAGMAAVVTVVRFALPTILNAINAHGGHELTVLFAVLMAGGGAYATQFAGWPPALGACIAGFLLAQADQRHQFVADITPFRDVFNAIFFIALGMQVNLAVVSEHAVGLSIAILATLVLKAIVTAGSVRAMGWPMRIGIQAGLGLCTVSEFGYVLAREAHTYNMIPSELLDLFIPYAVGAMLVGAILVPLAGPLSALIVDRNREDSDSEEAGHGEHLTDHVVVIGYGMNGKNLVRVLKATKIKCSVIEMNPALAREAMAEEVPVIVGDASRAVILHHAGIDTARAVVIAINDVRATRQIVGTVRALDHDIYMLVRTEFSAEIDQLLRLGASEVVPSDFEVSIKMFAHVLTEFRLPDNIIQSQIAAVRAGDYGVLRGLPLDARSDHLQELLAVFRKTGTQTFHIDENSPACGKTLANINLRATTGANIIAVVREGTPTPMPGGDFELGFGDVLVLVGSHKALDKARHELSGAPSDDAGA